MSTQADPTLIVMLRQDGVRIRRRSANQYWANCPFHDDSRPSFQVKLSNRGHWRFKCWSQACGVQGNTSDYRRLTRRPPDDSDRQPVPTQQPRFEYAPVSPEIHELAMAHYNSLLLQHPEAIQYLRDRGIDPDQAVHWGIGYAPGDTLYRILSRQMDDKELQTCPLLIHRRREDRNARRIIIPHHDPSNETCWHTARAIDPDRQLPYLSMPGVQPRPPLFFLRDHGHPSPSSLIITEGPFDLMATLSARYHGAATAGNPNPDRIAATLRLAGLTSIYILPDRDAGGLQWANILQQAAQEAGVEPHILELPDTFKDPAEILLSRRPSPAAIYGTIIRLAATASVRQPQPQPAQQTTSTPQQEKDDMAEYFGAQIYFHGNLTRDPEEKTNRNSDRSPTAASFSVAKNFHRWSVEEQKNVEDVVYYNCFALGIPAEQILKRRKGDLVWVSGEHQPREYNGNDGIPRTSQDVRVTDVHANLAFFSTADPDAGEQPRDNQRASNRAPDRQQAGPANAPPPHDDPLDIDDLPF